MNIYWHFSEVRIRLLYICFCFFSTFLVCYINVDVFIFLIIRPLRTNFIFINLFEGFYCFFLMSFFLSCFLTLFMVIYSTFDFVKSGLTKNEKNVLEFLFKLEIIISFFSIFFCYRLFLPHLIYFLLSFEQNKAENLFNFFFQPRLLDYILIFWSVFYLVFFLFQVPFLIFMCVQFRIVENSFFIRFRREFIVIFFFLGCLFSPPDIYSQVLLAFPCVFLYEAIIFSFIFVKNLLGELLEWLRGEFAKLWHTNSWCNRFNSYTLCEKRKK